MRRTRRLGTWETRLVPGSVVGTEEHEVKGTWERCEGCGRTGEPADIARVKSGNENVSSKGDVRDRGQKNREGGNRWERYRRREGRGRGSESRLTPEEIQQAVAEMDHETLLRAEACSEEVKVEEETEEQRERIVADELQEIVAAMSVEKVWRSFEKVRETWEVEAMAAASQRESGKDGNVEEKRWREKIDSKRKSCNF